MKIILILVCMAAGAYYQVSHRTLVEIWIVDSQKTAASMIENKVTTKANAKKTS